MIQSYNSEPSLTMAFCRNSFLHELHSGSQNRINASMCVFNTVITDCSSLKLMSMPLQNLFINSSTHAHTLYKTAYSVCCSWNGYRHTIQYLQITITHHMKTNTLTCICTVLQGILIYTEKATQCIQYTI